MNNLSLLQKPDYLRGIAIKGRLRWFFTRFKYAWQRITKGYCDEDLWELNNYYSKLIANSLYDFAQDANSYPWEEDSVESWKSRLIEIAAHFECTNEEIFTNPYWGQLMDMDRDDKDYEKTRLLMLEKEKEFQWCREVELKRALEGLGQAYWDLWD